MRLGGRIPAPEQPALLEQELAELQPAPQLPFELQPVQLLLVPQLHVRQPLVQQLLVRQPLVRQQLSAATFSATSSATSFSEVFFSSHTSLLLRARVQTNIWSPYFLVAALLVQVVSAGLVSVAVADALAVTDGVAIAGVSVAVGTRLAGEVGAGSAIAPPANVMTRPAVAAMAPIFRLGMPAQDLRLNIHA